MLPIDREMYCKLVGANGQRAKRDPTTGSGTKPLMLKAFVYIFIHQPYGSSKTGKTKTEIQSQNNSVRR